jgi:hypothetical protein
MRWLQGLDPLATQIGQETWFSPYPRKKIRLPSVLPSFNRGHKSRLYAS